MIDCILHHESIISLDDCNKIIDFFEDNPLLHSKGVVGSDNTPRLDIKNSTEIGMHIHSTQELKGEVNYIIAKGLEQSIKFYKKEYPFIDAIVPWNLDPIYNLQRYLPKEGYFNLHCENDGQLGHISRMLVWMIYLNDVSDGGYTDFPHQQKKIQPKAGDIIIWPSYWTHPHRGITSKTEKKYIATGWFRHL